MSVFDKPRDPMDDPAVIEQLQRTGVTDEPLQVGTFDNLGDAFVSGFPRGYYEGKAAAQKVLGFAAHAAESVTADIHFSPDAESYEAGLGDAGFERFRESEEQRVEADTHTDTEVARTARVADDYRPDPLSTGAAGQIANELSAILPRTLAAAPTGPAGMAIAAGGPAGLAESQRLQRAGVDPDTANTVGTVTGVTTGVGAILPAGGFASGPAADAALALAGNLGLGAAQRGATGKVLTDAGYPAMGAQYNAFDKTAMATDAAFSILLSGAHQLTSAQADAALTNRNADRYARGDGVIPVDSRSAAGTDAAKHDALGAILAGQRVDVAGHVADAELLRDPFHVTPELPAEVHQAAQAATTTADLYERTAEHIVSLESGGRANAKNPRSSATGAGQFIESTWLALIHRHLPELEAGKTREQLLALRTDADMSQRMVEQLARDNGQALQAAGLNPTPQLLYAAHHFGVSRAIELAKAADGTRISAILTPEELKANPYLAKLTKAGLLENWAKRGLGDEPGAPHAPEAIARAEGEGEGERAPPERTPIERAPSEPDPRLAELLTPPHAAPPIEGEPTGLVARVSNFVADLMRKPEAAPAPVALPADDPHIAAAQELVAQAPQHPIMVGFDADGAPSYRPVSEVLADIGGEHQLAAREASAYEAAAACFAQQGVAA